jgi:5-methylcytosine-specific restriction endonuclease McrA
MEVWIRFFGSEIFLSGKCEPCEAESFIIDGRLQCCYDAPETLELKGSKRITLGGKRKSLMGAKEKARLMLAQNYRCYWCGTTFWSLYRLAGKRQQALKPEVDHNVPFSFSNDNHPANLVLACDLCNGLKSNHMFDTETECQEFLLKRRQAIGYTLEAEAQRIRIMSELRHSDPKISQMA